MKRNIFAVGMTAFLMATSAGAATLDFIDLANGAETGISNGDSLVIDGVNVTFSATNSMGSSGEVAAYLDSGNAGLGVCSNWTATASVNDNECNPSSDDNVTAGESVTLTFDDVVAAFTIDIFKDAGHGNLNSNSETLIINGVEYTFADALTTTFSGTDTMTFEYGGSNANQFYIGAAQVALVPLPAAGLLLLGGVGGLAALRRRRKSA